MHALSDRVQNLFELGAHPASFFSSAWRGVQAIRKSEDLHRDRPAIDIVSKLLPIPSNAMQHLLGHHQE